MKFDVYVLSTINLTEAELVLLSTKLGSSF